MKKFFGALLALAMLLISLGCSAEAAGKHILVAYFSATGNTEQIAQTAAKLLDAELYEIRPAVPYTDADLDWTDSSSRTTLEQNDDACRPELAEAVPDLSAYDTILIGHPIWWGQAPKLIYTFVEQENLSGKTVSTFCTSASSPLGSSAENLKKVTGADVIWLQSRRFPTGANEGEISGWLREIGLM